MKRLAFLVLLLSVTLMTFAQNVRVLPQSEDISKVYSVAFSPNGRQIVSGSINGVIKLWDIATGREIRTFQERRDDYWGELVISVSFSSDGRQVVSGNMGGAIKLWDVATGREIRTFQEGENTGADSYSFLGRSVSFSPDGRQVISGGYWDIKLWDVATGREIRNFAEEMRGGFSSFSPDGRQVISGINRYIILWDASTGREIRRFRIPPMNVPDSDWMNSRTTVYSVSFSPDGRQVVASFSLVTSSEGVKLWDAATGREIRSFAVGVCESASFSPDGRQIVSVSGRGMRLWDIATGREIRRFGTISDRDSGGHSVSFSPNGRQIVSALDGTVRIWDASTGNEVAQFVSFSDGEWVVLTPDNYYSASPNGDRHLRVHSGDNVLTMEMYSAISNQPQNVFNQPQRVEARLTESANLR